MQESKKIFYDVKIKERYMMEELYKTNSILLHQL